MKLICAVFVSLLLLVTQANAYCRHCSPAYKAAIDVGFGGDRYTSNGTIWSGGGGNRPWIGGGWRPGGGWGSGGQQVTRVYLMRGLGHLSNFAPLSRDLRATGAVVRVYGWASRGRIVRDALRHRGDRIIVGGHSQGDKSAFIAGARLQSRGVPVHVIGMDPLCTFPQASPGLWGVNIWGNYCGGYQGTVAGAENIYIGGIGHVVYPTNPSVRSKFVEATYWN